MENLGLFVIAVYGFRHGVYAVLGEHYSHGSWLHIYLYETVKIGLFLGLWLGVLFGFYSFLAWREQQHQLLAVQHALTDARLQQMKAQLQPHFLFNTLNTISGFMHSDVARADRLLAQLADLLRANLTLGERHSIPLADELRLLRLYADIMTQRFTPQVTIHWDIADEVLGIMVPALLLQPLLENAFKHGVEQSTEPSSITLRARRGAGQLQIALSNSSVVVSGARRELVSTGVGLRNCRERLHVIYGAHARLQLQAHADRFEVDLVLPEHIA
jgi:two-component system, LytTR family, sensor kinase